MRTLVDEHAHLRAADDHLRIALRLVSAQEDRVARGRAAGLDTELSEELLCTMRAILQSLIAHRNAICRAIEVEGQSPCARAKSAAHSINRRVTA
ncbi:hypothetical protein C7H84_22585 [Burkholderia sp. Nafp2/4-1b]|uniref:hypothetical protein n=1 Tax=Burkholderia sp. Nafp2/4-1b TaxID=2116686 RepID=UPI000EF861D2|nr:hypothetical protein [Burkholderia sp. Nafp2/4-1b]RKU01167.1 hypothetical protein C7H84_22585 [Burkholderia sp. Nafp2/4-1b]